MTLSVGVRREPVDRGELEGGERLEAVVLEASAENCGALEAT